MVEGLVNGWGLKKIRGERFIKKGLKTRFP